MSTRTVTTTTCDITKCGEAASKKGQRVSIVFTTDETEGRAVTPYLQLEPLDFCTNHYQQYIDSFPLKAHGAQGHNTYYFKEEK